ncbi:hypothetical protein [Microbacterium sp. zg.Y909]|uniref:hypothetical protein n=1 Tax=Microbacterium sp. zg.Y909 TaxID=2969413 RepID=UPI00214B6E26|nr:hypothetical protein [Microbacterium sp. zg.Y909]MCR2824948.1 hypothetical protein [Microbacterium sp. zg.Y909]
MAFFQNGRVVQPVIPDGVLTSGGNVVASFEAKYTNPMHIPAEGHIYQTLAAAGVLDAPLAFLIYPSDAPLQVYDVKARGNQEMKLATLGLDLYGYRRDGGAEERASKLLDVMNSLAPVPS